MRGSQLAELQNGARSFGIELDQTQLDRFATYHILLLEWNQRVNLTAITDPIDVQRRHFLDSLSCLLATGELTGQALIDVGSGAGFPGLPLKIVTRELDLALVESVGKKCRFLETVVSELGLDTVTILNDRVEIIGQNPLHRQRYDWAVARAVSSLNVLAEYLLPLVKVGGSILAQKGDTAHEQMEAAGRAFSVLGGGSSHLVPVNIPGIPMKRFLVVVKKLEPTSTRYPRRAGIPAKRPLP